MEREKERTAHEEVVIKLESIAHRSNYSPNMKEFLEDRRNHQKLDETWCRRRDFECSKRSHGKRYNGRTSSNTLKCNSRSSAEQKLMTKTPVLMSAQGEDNAQKVKHELQIHDIFSEHTKTIVW